MTVADAGVEVKQTSITKFTLTFGSAVENLVVEDINVDELVKVVAGDDKVNYLVKAVTLAEDKKSAEVEVFFPFTDAASYEVTVKGYDTQTFVASNGAPVSAVLHSDKDIITKRNVLVNNSTQIWATLYDANGIDVTTDKLREKLTYIIKYVDSDYEVTDNALYFAEAGERAVVKVEYHTYEYLENGDEKDFFTSVAYTFVAVDKATTEVEKIDKFSTLGDIRRTDDTVKLTQEGTLVVRLKLSDDVKYERPIDVDKFNYVLTSKDGNEVLGKVNFASLTQDLLEVNDVNGKVELYPRKAGTARVMMSLITSVNGYDVESPIGILTIKVLAEPTLDAVRMGQNGVNLCVNPKAANTGANALGVVEDPWIRILIDNQYEPYSDSYKNVFTPEFKGTNALSKRAVEVGALKWAANPDPANSWQMGVQFDTDKFLAILNDIDEEGKDVNAAKFNFTVTVQDKKTYATKTASFFVDARRATDTNDNGFGVDDMTIELVTTANDALNDSKNNVARVNTYKDNGGRYYNWNTEGAKAITFAPYFKNNGAKWDEIKVTGALPTKTADVEVASTGYYYVVNKGGKNISSSSTVSVADNGSGSIFTLNFSKDMEYSQVVKDMVPVVTKIKTNMKYVHDVYDEDQKKVVSVNDYKSVGTPITSYEVYNSEDFNMAGAGTYEFILYEIVNNEDTDYENKVVRKASSAISVTCDLGGSYKLVSRNSVKTDANASNLDDSEFQQALLQCFTFADREGVTYKKEKVDDDNYVTFENGQVRKFFVSINNEKAKSGSVYVEKVTFWEPVQYDDWEANNVFPVDDKNAQRYAEYTVNVGCFVNVE